METLDAIGRNNPTTLNFILLCIMKKTSKDITLFFSPQLKLYFHLKIKCTTKLKDGWLIRILPLTFGTFLLISNFPSTEEGCMELARVAQVLHLSPVVLHIRILLVTTSPRIPGVIASHALEYLHMLHPRVTKVKGSGNRASPLLL